MYTGLRSEEIVKDIKAAPQIRSVAVHGVEFSIASCPVKIERVVMAEDSLALISSHCL